MYKWNIDIFLKGSGVVKHCMYEGPESNSADVFMELFNNKPTNEMLGLSSDDRKVQIFILMGEIASIDISERKKRWTDD